MEFKYLQPGVHTEVIDSLDEEMFEIKVFQNDILMEHWGNLTLDPTSRFYAPTYLDQVSEFIKVDEI
jgi:hypothetical protein